PPNPPLRCGRTNWGVRGRGRERTAVAAWPGEWRQVARWSGLVAARAACFVFRSRRPAGRPAGSAGGFPAGPAGVSCRGPAQRAGPAAWSRPAKLAVTGKARSCVFLPVPACPGFPLRLAKLSRRMQGRFSACPSYRP
ncbi:hypothetical protein, partial [Sporomusa sphaeroides]|uniref:hypothetical protein n=1 Tax=Sporomusa sphaeroides TaxID=47679 RepID=UPI001C6349F9